MESEEIKDIDLFMQLYASVQRRLYVYIVTFILDSSEAEDLLQETNIVMWNKFDQYEQDTNFLAWARQIARNNILNYRQLKRHSSTILLDNDAMNAVMNVTAECDRNEDEQRRAALVGCLEKLTASERELIQNRYQPSFSVDKMSEKLHCSPNSLSKRFGRIRRILRDCVYRVIAKESQ